MHSVDEELQVTQQEDRHQSTQKEVLHRTGMKLIIMFRARGDLTTVVGDNLPAQATCG
jgi:hypothetical protein